MAISLATWMVVSLLGPNHTGMGEPIARYLMRHPWALPRFLNRTPPASGG